VQSDTDLLQIISALCAASGLARTLHGGHDEGDENRDYRDHDQQFDQSKAAFWRRVPHRKPQN